MTQAKGTAVRPAQSGPALRGTGRSPQAPQAGPAPRCQPPAHTPASGTWGRESGGVTRWVARQSAGNSEVAQFPLLQRGPSHLLRPWEANESVLAKHVPAQMKEHQEGPVAPGGWMRWAHTCTRMHTRAPPHVHAPSSQHCTHTQIARGPQARPTVGPAPHTGTHPGRPGGPSPAPRVEGGPRATAVTTEGRPERHREVAGPGPASPPAFGAKSNLVGEHPPAGGQASPHAA